MEVISQKRPTNIRIVPVNRMAVTWVCLKRVKWSSDLQIFWSQDENYFIRIYRYTDGLSWFNASKILYVNLYSKNGDCLANIQHQQESWIVSADFIADNSNIIIKRLIRNKFSPGNKKLIEFNKK